jgi:leucyl aminopeptidase
VTRVEIARGELPGEGNLVLFVGRDGRSGEVFRSLDAASSGLLARAFASLGQPRHGQILELPFPAGLGYERLFLVVIGKDEPLRPLDLEEVGAKIADRLAAARVRDASVAAPAGIATGLDPETQVRALATGLRLRSYRFTKYRKPPEEEEGVTPVERVRFFADGVAERVAAEVTALTDAVAFTRDLVSEPANVLYPESFARICEGLREFGVEVEVFDRDALERLGMNALLAVGQGSARPPFMVVMRWKGADAGAPLALVGKGVCFDTGGISIKPAQGMEQMKWDMAGAAAVVGAMRALAVRGARADVVGAIGLAENMPSGTAQRPGDVIRTYAGKTVEVINTDAEGRLVLADVVAYVCERFAPAAVVDLATLTGAIIVALGHEKAGLFANDDALAAALAEAGEEVGEPLWRMPLGREYEKHIRSDIADIKNTGRGREAGSIAGAVFIQQFVGDRPWAHLDIAGVAWASRDTALVRKGATGFGVRLLDRLVARRYEQG